MTGPVKKYTAGGVACCLWENQINVDGRPKAVLKATVERRYKDASGQWKSTGSFDRYQIPIVCHLLQKAFEDMLGESDGQSDGKEMEA